MSHIKTAASEGMEASWNHNVNMATSKYSVCFKQVWVLVRVIEWSMFILCKVQEI